MASFSVSRVEYPISLGFDAPVSFTWNDRYFACGGSPNIYEVFPTGAYRLFTILPRSLSASRPVSVLGNKIYYTEYVNNIQTIYSFDMVTLTESVFYTFDANYGDLIIRVLREDFFIAAQYDTYTTLNAHHLSPTYSVQTIYRVTWRTYSYSAIPAYLDGDILYCFFYVNGKLREIVYNISTNSLIFNYISDYAISSNSTFFYDGVFYQFGGYASGASDNQQTLLWFGLEGHSYELDFISTPPSLTPIAQPVAKPDYIIYLFSSSVTVYKIDYFDSVCSINDYNGAPLTTITKYSNIANIQCIYADKVCTVTINNSLDSSATFSVPVIPDKEFIGLSMVANSSIAVIPADGEVHDIDVEGDTTFYLAYGINRPIPNPIEAGLYQNTADARIVDKSSYLDKIADFNGVIRDDCDVVHPVVRLQYDTLPDFNYVGIAELNRYYFVTDVKYIAKGLWDIYLECDVLMTWKDGIRQCTAFVDRNAFPPEESNYITDTQRVVEQGEDVTTLNFPRETGGLAFSDDEQPHIFVLDAYFTYGGDS